MVLIVSELVCLMLELSQEREPRFLVDDAFIYITKVS